MVDWDAIDVAVVGRHSGAGKQAHVPLGTLDELGADVGDRLVFKVRRGEALIQVRRRVSSDFACPFCQDGYDDGEALAAHLEDEHPEQLPEDDDDDS